MRPSSAIANTIASTHSHRLFQVEVVIAEAEACAEKLARYRRIPLGRDAYDLDKFGQRSMDERLVRRLWVLKVWCDVVDDNKGVRPLEPAQVLHARRAQDFVPDSLGILTHPMDLDAIEI